MCCRRIFLLALKTSGLTLCILLSIWQARADDVVTLTHQGAARTATIHEPRGLPPGPSPVVIGLYGRGQGIDRFRNRLHLDATADRGGFRAVYPDAIEKEWSYGRPIVRSMPIVNGQSADDLGFIRLLIDNLVETKRADPKRIYVTGLSRGGLMTFTVACALADRIAAAAPLIAGMTEYQRDACRPAKAMPIIAVDGTNDRDLFYDGELATLGRLLSVPETMEYWREKNGCTRQARKKVQHRDPSDPTRIWQIDWTDCSSGAPLRLYRVNGGGHQVPSLSPNSEVNFKHFGKRNHDIETADEIWSFVKNFSR
jgi:polyhydroxybutyrate depolymerase